MSHVGLKIVLIILGNLLLINSLKLKATHQTLLPLPDPVYGGEIHYSRIPVEYWEHRIQMMKALGFNALSVYVIWNHHEVRKGVFDYETDNRNLNKFLSLAEQYEMKVLIRPGPYICAQWDFGGLPARLYNVEGLVIRTNNEPYLKETRIFFQSLAPIFKKHLHTQENPNGSIIMLQIQNEYGFYGNDQTYMQALKDIWRDLGVHMHEYYVDWILNIKNSYEPGISIGINNFLNQAQYNFVKKFAPNNFIFGGEVYSGWLTHWHEEWQHRTIEENQKAYGFLLQNNHSFSMYMAHGGTNFGLTAGANAFLVEQNPTTDYQPITTSYDYDAPINEQGSPAPKYLPLRNLFKKYVPYEIPDMPDPIPLMKVSPFSVHPVAKLFNNLGEGIKSSKPEVFESSALEMYNQGIVVYSTTIGKGSHTFTMVIRDFGLIYLDGNLIDGYDRCLRRSKTLQIQCDSDTCQLEIVVEAMGHINFDSQMASDRKGLMKFESDTQQQFEWTMYKVNLDESLLKWNNIEGELENNPILSEGKFTVNEVADTYLDMSEFRKGYVWVNGRNLGRYWNVGPQYRLYCPGVWLKEGVNVVQVLELMYDGVKEIEGVLSLK